MVWQSAPSVEDIFQRKKRRSPLLRIGGAFFALLALISLVDAMRAAPLSFGGGVVASTLEAIVYRLVAALLCGLLAVWLLLPQRGRGSDDRLLR